MIDAKSLLDQFLGSGAGQNISQKIGQTGANIGGGDLMGQAKRGLDALGGGKGLAVGGLLGLLVANKTARKTAGTVAVYGGAAALGLLAFRAFRNWQEGQKPGTAPVAQSADIANVDPKYLPSNAPAKNGQPFELSLIQAMIAAAKSDGHMDATEQQRLFGEIERMTLDAETKGAVFDLLSKTVSVEQIAAQAANEEQAAELYLASRIAIDPDDPNEQAHLSKLTQKLQLPPELVAHLDRQVEETLKAAQAA